MPATVYTKDEVDQILATKADKATVDSKNSAQDTTIKDLIARITKLETPAPPPPPPATNVLWSSAAWSNGQARTLAFGQKDPYDSKLVVKGNCTVSIDGNGVAKLSGAVGRIYLLVPHENVRITFMARTLSQNASLDTSRGHVIEARTSEHHSTSPDPLGVAYAGYIRYDQTASWKKELTHNYYTAETARVSATFTASNWNKCAYEIVNTSAGVRLTNYLNDVPKSTYEDSGNWLVSSTNRKDIIKNGLPFPGQGLPYPVIILRDTDTVKEFKDVVIEAI